MTTKNRLRLPIGIQTFSEIREGGYYYVDKTPHIERLVNQNKYYFLSRPRRFGKSLLLDTLRCLFDGHQDLFEGLYIYDKWDWQIKHPVIRLSFGSGVMRDRGELDVRIRDQIQVARNDLGLPPATRTDIAGEFLALIRDAHDQYQQPVVVLIDEYDKPILDNILDPDKARELREGLKNLYSALKDADPHLRMVLLTGVSKFSKASLFSGLNNLRDITLSPEYATVCGYTDEDIDRVFEPELGALDRDMVRDWYNGYRWGGQDVTSVYNPFDVLLLFDEKKFGAYWFETATPTFLIDILKQRGIFTPALDHLIAKTQLLNQFDVDDISTEGLLFQTGYLTIKDVKEPKPGLQLFTLGFPNLEVESSLNDALLPALGVNRNDAQTLQIKLLDLLENHDVKGLQSHLQALFA
ncbi:MAG: AAA family ATPase, partial [Burkholderiaceae bacterium]|nr:AAA family ATPase [Burkholderiaceae bacterium]